MLTRLLNRIKRALTGDEADRFEVNEERRRMLIDYQRSDYYND